MTIKASASTLQGTAADFFGQAAEAGVLNLPYCRSCGRSHWYPRKTCPFCSGRDVEWQASSSRAVLHTFSIIGRATPPYVLAYVELAEGPLMLTNIVASDPSALHIGQALTLSFEAGPAGSLPMFRPVQDIGHD